MCGGAFWTIFAAIAQILSAVAAFTAAGVALWLASYRPCLKIVSVGKYMTQEGDFIRVSVLNTGNRVVRVTAVYARAKGEKYSFHVGSILPANDVWYDEKDLPDCIEIGRTADIKIKESSYRQGVVQIRNKRKDKESILLCVRDSSGREYSTVEPTLRF